MPCIRPLEAARATGSDEKPVIYKRGERPNPLAPGYEPLELPCGQCVKCRLEHSRVWAARLVQEDYTHYMRDQDSMFVTFTYRDPWHCDKNQLADGLHVPSDGSLDHSHIQKFFKRLRKHFAGRTIRYYQCGEYGDETNRPHHHAILYNVSFPDKELIKEDQSNSLFISETLDDLWKFGYCWFGSVTFESCAYVARYCMKKVTGKKAHYHYLRESENGEKIYLRPEYATMSNGIGKEFYERYKTDMYPDSRMPIPGRNAESKPPRYYDKLLGEDDPATLLEAQLNREKWFREHHGELTPQRLAAIGKVAEARLKVKKRGL